MDALDTLLNTTSGLQRKVYKWRREDFAESELPAAAFHDFEGPAEPLAAGYTEHVITINVLINATGDDCDTTIRTLAANILATIATDKTLGGLVDAIEYNGLNMSGEVANKKIAAGQVRLSVTYQTENFAF